MILKNAEIGGIYTVNSLKLERAVMRRLEALGLTRGTRIRILNRSRAGAVILMVRGTRLALGGRITEAIDIKEA